MALSFVKKSKAPAAKPAPVQTDLDDDLDADVAETDEEEEEEEEEAAPAPKAKATKPKADGAKKLPSWLHTGKKAKEETEKELADTERRRAEAQTRVYRFWLKAQESAHITFLDGDLDEDGLLDIPKFYEHKVRINGKWDNVVCTDSSEPCPICAAGDKHRYVGVVTVIDHRKIKSTKKPGVVWRDQPKLYVITSTSLATLQAQAKKRGGLKGWRVEVTRTSDEKARIGDVWDFEERLSDEELMEHFGKEGVLPVPDYAVAIPYYSAAELKKLGVGKAGPAPIGAGGGGAVVDEDDDLE